MKHITLENLNDFAIALANKITGKFVLRENGKGLSANDYTAEDKEKLERAVPGTRKVNNKELAKDIVLAASDIGAIPTNEKGIAGGVAELDGTGKIPAAQLPSYVDDVIEGYLYNGIFYKETEHTTKIAAESGKIYIDIGNKKTYRWSGTAFAVISDTIALGETSTTAYRGDRGKSAYEHSQTKHAPANAEANVQADWQENDSTSSSFIKNKPVEATTEEIDNIIAGLFIG